MSVHHWSSAPKEVLVRKLTTVRAAVLNASGLLGLTCSLRLQTTTAQAGLNLDCDRKAKTA